MTDEFVNTIKMNRTGHIVLNRPRALNSLSLEMVRSITAAASLWRDDDAIKEVVIRSTSEKAFCAGGDIRFFYDVGRATPQQGSALLDDFFNEEYALNHLLHHFPKPVVAVMDGIIMGGGMGLAQCGPGSRMRIVTERTKMAMPEVNIGLFPDVGGSYFLSRCPGQIGAYLGITGDVIHAADALYAGLADVFVPSTEIGALMAQLARHESGDIRATIRTFAAPFASHPALSDGRLALQRTLIDTVFCHDSVQEIVAVLAQDDSASAAAMLAMIDQRSPLMMCVTLAQIRRGAALSVADCLRMERTMIRRAFEHGEVIEGVRAMVIDKDNQPVWHPASLAAVSPSMIETFFKPAWPDHAHPLRGLA